MFTTAPIVDTCDTSILDAWEENHRKQLKDKRAASELKRTAALKAGDEVRLEMLGVTRGSVVGVCLALRAVFELVADVLVRFM